MNHFRHVWDKARCSLGQRKTGEEVRSGSLNRVTRPAGDNDIYARQVYDVWSVTHELRVGHRRRRRSKSAESSNVCARECPERSVSSRVRVISWKCDFQSFAHISNVAATDLRTDDIYGDLCKILCFLCTIDLSIFVFGHLQKPCAGSTIERSTINAANKYVINSMFLEI